MSKFGDSFTYNNVSSDNYNLILCSFETSDTTPLGLSRSINKGETNNYRYKPNHLGVAYSDVLTFDITVMKDPCGVLSQDDLYFSRSEIREITAWLTSPKTPKLFHIDDDEDDYVDYYGLVTDITANSIEKIYSLTFTFTCDSPFAYSKEYIHSVVNSSTSTGTNYTLTVTNDELDDYIYPILEITASSTGQVFLENVTDNSGQLIIQCKNKNTVYIDCQRLIIYDVAGIIDYEDLGLEDVDNFYWFRLLNGKNEIRLVGDATVKIKYREVRKVGAY